MAWVVASFFAYLPYEVFTGVDLMTAKHITSYDGDRIFKTSTEYSYNQKNQLSKTTIYKSDHSKEISTISYPTDYNSGTVFIDEMNANNLNSYPIEQVVYREIDDTRKILSGRITKYKLGGQGLNDQVMNLDVKTPIPLTEFQFSNKPVGILPVSGTSTAFLADTKYEVSVNYINYDSNGNPLSLFRQMGPKISYKWGYKNQYPIVEIKNSAINEFYSQNFEEYSLGLDFDRNVSIDLTKGHTGNYCGNLSNVGTTKVVSYSGKGITISLTTSKKFTYSGWVYSNGSSAEICLIMMRAGETGQFSYIDSVKTSEINKWVYVVKEFLVPSDVVHIKLRIGNNEKGKVWFDDLRIQPSDAAMSTYTYEPLVGMTSTIDEAGKTVYFEYDGFQRLKNIKNHKGEIIKSYDYHYKP